MRARTLLVSSALVAALALAGCAEKADPETEPTPTPTPTPTADTGQATPSPSETADDRQVVEIKVEGGRTTPNGSTVKVDAGEPVVLRITADEAGELHLHTSPEQTVAYEAGRSEHEIRLGRPGVFEVESHDLHVVIVKLQAS